jgi:DNA-binding CsgD family transcriptional regulator
MWSDALDEARTLFQDLFEQTLRAGAQNSLVTLHLQLAEVENRSARWRAGEAHAREGAALARDVRHESIQGLHLFQQALAWAYLGRLDDASDQLAEASAISGETHEDLYLVHYESLLGFIELSRDDYETAYERLGPLPDRIGAMGARDPGFFYLVPNVIETLVGLGRLEAARAEIARLEDSGRRLARHRALAFAARGRALVEQAEGDTDAALGSLQAALKHHERLPDPFEQGRTLLALGTVRRRARQRRAARESLQAALDLFERNGASVWADKARSELDRIGGRTPAGKELTPSEQRIAELVAEGKTNREVAAELFLSVHTVEAALTRVYQKLGIRSRTELARRLAAETRR